MTQGVAVGRQYGHRSFPNRHRLTHPAGTDPSSPPKPLHAPCLASCVANEAEPPAVRRLSGRILTSDAGKSVAPFLARGLPFCPSQADGASA